VKFVLGQWLLSTSFSNTAAAGLALIVFIIFLSQLIMCLMSKQISKLVIGHNEIKSIKERLQEAEEMRSQLQRYMKERERETEEMRSQLQRDMKERVRETESDMKEREEDTEEMKSEMNLLTEKIKILEREMRERERKEQEERERERRDREITEQEEREREMREREIKEQEERERERRDREITEQEEREREMREREIKEQEERERERREREMSSYVQLNLLSHPSLSWRNSVLTKSNNKGGIEFAMSSYSLSTTHCSYWRVRVITNYRGWYIFPGITGATDVSSDMTNQEETYLYEDNNYITGVTDCVTPGITGATYVSWNMYNQKDTYIYWSNNQIVREGSSHPLSGWTGLYTPNDEAVFKYDPTAHTLSSYNCNTKKIYTIKNIKNMTYRIVIGAGWRMSVTVESVSETKGREIFG